MNAEDDWKGVALVLAILGVIGLIGMIIILRTIKSKARPPLQIK